MTPQSAQIREASRAGVAVVARLVSESFKDIAAMFDVTPENYPVFPAFCQPDWITEGFDNGVRFFVMEHGGVPAGCVGMAAPNDGACELVRLAVLKEHRHGGCGEALVRHVLEQASGLGLKRVDLALVAANIRLLRWYETLGFVETHRNWPPHLPFEVAFMNYELVGGVPEARLC